LFMAGDKQFFYFLNKTKQKLGLKISFLGENLLERTDFKSGYCGVPPGSEDEDRVYMLSVLDKIKLSAYYAKEFLINPAYINASLFNSLTAFISYYQISKDYINIYRYIQWEEKKSKRDNHKRIWLGNSFGHPINLAGRGWHLCLLQLYYYTVGGFSEIETFRSNQIREGAITRQEAWRLSCAENKPRFESIKMVL